jgi:hypothetical protein
MMQISINSTQETHEEHKAYELSLISEKWLSRFFARKCRLCECRGAACPRLMIHPQFLGKGVVNVEALLARASTFTTPFPKN